jgi:hypothetical protein
VINVIAVARRREDAFGQRAQRPECRPDAVPAEIGERPAAKLPPEANVIGAEIACVE